jgi:hypothetical protein
MGHSSTKLRSRRGFSNFALYCCVAACSQAANSEPLAGSDPDLSVAAVKHWAECPLPKESACVIRKPVDTGYRILTTGANLDDAGDQWVADFTKLKDPKSPQLLLRVLSRNGELHEIVVNFPKEALPPEKPVVKKKKKRQVSKPKPEKTS